MKVKGVLISFQFCTENGESKVKVSGVLTSLHIKIRLKMKYSGVLFSFQSGEIIKITSDFRAPVFHLFNFWVSIIKTVLWLKASISSFQFLGVNS